MVELFTYENLFPPNFNWWQPETNPHRTQIESPWDRWSPAVVAAVEGAQNIVIPSHGWIVSNAIMAIPRGMTLKVTSIIGTKTCIILNDIYGEYMDYLQTSKQLHNQNYLKHTDLKNPQLIKKRQGAFTKCTEKGGEIEFLEWDTKKHLWPPEEQGSIYDFAKNYRQYSKELTKNRVGVRYPIDYNLTFAPDEMNLTTIFKSGNIIPDIQLKILPPTKHTNEYAQTNIMLRIISKNMWEYTDVIFTGVEETNLSKLLDKIYGINNKINILTTSCFPFSIPHKKDPTWIKCLDFLPPHFQTGVLGQRRRSSYAIALHHNVRLIQEHREKYKGKLKEEKHTIKDPYTIEAQFTNIDFEKFVWNFLRLFPESKRPIWYTIFRKELEDYDPHKLFVLNFENKKIIDLNFLPCIIIILWNYRVGCGKYLLFDLARILDENDQNKRIEKMISFLQSLHNPNPLGVGTQGSAEKALICKKIIKKRNKRIFQHFFSS